MKIFNKSEWKKVKLGDICEVITGNTPSKKIKEYWDKDEVPFITPPELKYEGINYITPSIFVSKIGAKEGRIISKNSICVCCIGSLGKLGILKDDAITNQQINSLILKDKNIDLLYLYFYLKTTKNNLEAMASSTTVKIINKSSFEKIEIKLPDIRIQKKISKKLEILENNINFRKKQLTYLKELNKSLFTRMFGDIRSNSKNFEIKNLDSIYYIRSSKRVFEKDYKKEGVPFFRSKEIVELSNSKNIIPEIYISFDKYEELKKVSGIPLKGDLLITAVGTIGKIWKVNYEKDFYFKDGNLIWLQLKNKNNFNSLSLKRILEDSIKNEKENLTSGSAYNALTIDKLKKIDIIIPPMKLQNKFAERIEKIEKLSFNFSNAIFFTFFDNKRGVA